MWRSGGCWLWVPGVLVGLTGCTSPSGPPSAPLPATPAAAVAGEPVANQAAATGPLPPREVDWAAAGDCRAKLQLLHRLAAGDQLDDVAATPFVVVTAGGGIDWRTIPVTLHRDLPIRVGGGGRGRPADGATAPCAIHVAPPSDLEAGHQVIDYEEIASQRQSGTRSGRNPDYDAVKERARRAESRLKQADSSFDRVLRSRPISRGTDDYVSAALELMGYALDGVTHAFQGRAEEAELDDALSELATLKSSTDRPVYQPYTFERQLVRAGREATFDLELRDLETGQVWRSRLRQREVRELAVVDGLDPGDRDVDVYRGGSFSPRKLQYWERQPPLLPLSAVVTSLLDGPGAAAPRASPAGAPPPPPPPAATDADVPAPAPSRLPERPEPDAMVDAGPPDASLSGGGPDLDSVVWVAAKGRGGPGVYVRPYVALTALDQVRGAAVVDLVQRSGRTALGLVVRTDPVRSIAVIHVPRAGTPAPLQPGPAAGQTVPASVAVLHGPEGAEIVRGELTGATNGALTLTNLPDRDLAGAPVFVGAALVGLLAASPSGSGAWAVTRLAPLAPLIDDRPSGPQTAARTDGGAPD